MAEICEEIRRGRALRAFELIQDLLFLEYQGETLDRAAWISLVEDYMEAERHND